MTANGAAYDPSSGSHPIDPDWDGDNVATANQTWWGGATWTGGAWSGTVWTWTVNGASYPPTLLSVP